MTRSRSAPLWVLTTYYNPAGCDRQRMNFKAFRRMLQQPLLVVELARDGRHELSDDDGEIVIRLTGEDRLWQKERLLDVGLEALPRHVEFAAWIDCDLVFPDDEWAAKAVKRLAKNGGMLQLFDRCTHHLPRDADPRTLSPRCNDFTPLFSGVAVASALRASTFTENELRLAKARTAPDLASRHRIIDGHNCYGMAWAAPRATIEACGQYDRNVVGGGDSVHVLAAMDRLDDHWALRAHSAKQVADAAAWAHRAARAGLFASLNAPARRRPSHVARRRRQSQLSRPLRNSRPSRLRSAGRNAKAANRNWRWIDPESPSRTRSARISSRGAKTALASRMNKWFGDARVRTISSQAVETSYPI